MSSGDAATDLHLTYALLADCTIVSLTFFEHLVTLEQEIKVIWRRKFTGATLLFIVNRYVTLMLAFLILGSLSLTDERRYGFETSSVRNIIAQTVFSCSRTRQAIQITAITLSVTFLAFSTLRTFAIAGYNRVLWTVPVLILTFVPIPISIYYWTISLDVYINEPRICARLINIPTKGLAIGSKDHKTTASRTIAHTDLAELAYRGSLVLANFLILTLIIRRTLLLYLRSRVCKVRTPLIKALLQDGAIFFLTFLIFNIITLLAEFVPALFALAPAGSLLQEVTPILMSRFMLNLRQASDGSGESISPSPSRFASDAGDINFRIPQSVIGNLGESFEDDTEGEDEIPIDVMSSSDHNHEYCMSPTYNLYAA